MLASGLSFRELAKHRGSCRRHGRTLLRLGGHDELGPRRLGQPLAAAENPALSQEFNTVRAVEDPSQMRSCQFREIGPRRRMNRILNRGYVCFTEEAPAGIREISKAR